MADQLKYTTKLKDKNVLVVGGTSGIGFGVAQAALEHGARVTISSSKQARVDDALARLTKAIPSAKDRVQGYAYNFADKDTIESNVVELLERSSAQGKLDHIAWTAGDMVTPLALSDATVDDAMSGGMVRFFGPLMVGKHATRYLNPGPASSITLTTGSVAQKPVQGWTVRSGFNSGLLGLNRSLALDLKPIRVNIVSPGAVHTELWEPYGKEMIEKVLAGLASSTLTGRAGRVEDVAEAYIYLMKDQNITGDIISTSSGGLLV